MVTKILQFPKLVRIQGKWNTKEIWLNGRKLDPSKSQRVRNHSPNGFNYSYGGSAPAQLALAIMLEFFPEDEAVQLYQHFKRDVIAALPQCDFDMKIDIDEWREKLAAEGI